MNKLIIADDEGKTTVVPLVRDEITIGRKEGNTIRLTERNARAVDPLERQQEALPVGPHGRDGQGAFLAPPLPGEDAARREALGKVGQDVHDDFTLDSMRAAQKTDCQEYRLARRGRACCWVILG